MIGSPGMREIRHKPKRRINWFSIFIGAVVLSFAVESEWYNLKFYARSTVTLGEVMELNAGRFHPRVEFMTDKGERLSFAGSSEYPVQVGDRLEVRYLRSDPHIGPVVNQMPNLFDFLPAVIGIAFMIAGLLGVSLFRFKPRDDISETK
ncbi:DUF3592 domain-containing protein (plasmid) [Caballeronia sp. NK8]|uniref:DUF3592 domain-containing protein n=1 Tax=Caballeronia sp. NK8 TaxID=140098 RepID=UPI001BB70A05|nr:DUF3592 domain-containing protein [Caballeronia sp. NK8]BCQ27820.1 DUF3592 domain-containing protein [Caballeronia sp. NK8]